VHELAVCQSLLERVRQVAIEHGAASVARITVGIGPLSGVEPHLLQQAWPIASAGSVAGNAEMEVEVLPLVVSCETCGAETAASPNRLVCGSCGDWHTRLTSGDELLLNSVELEKVTDTVDAGVPVAGEENINV